MEGFKAFDKDMKCRDQQYEVGKTVTHNGDVKLCNSGLHFCEEPLDVLAYYPPTSRFAEVEADGVSSEKEEDSKRVSKSLTVEEEISLAQLLTTGIKFRLIKYDFDNAPDKATGTSGAASATGTSGAASATGTSGAASATGEEGCAIALGIEGKAMAALGGWITVAEWSNATGLWHRIAVKTAKVDGKKIKPLTWYSLKAGKFIAS